MPSAGAAVARLLDSAADTILALVACICLCELMVRLCRLVFSQCAIPLNAWPAPSTLLPLLYCLARAIPRYELPSDAQNDRCAIPPTARAVCFPEPQLSDVKHHGTPGQSQCRASHFVSILVPQELTVKRIEERHRLLPRWRARLSWVDKAPRSGDSQFRPRRLSKELRTREPSDRDRRF